MLKKISYVLNIILITALIFFMIQYYRVSSSTVSSSEQYPEIYDFLDSITIDNFYNKLESRESFIIYIGRPSCSDCNILDERLIPIIEENNLGSELIYLNITPLHKQDEPWQKFKTEFNITGTPTFAYFQNGELVDQIGWTVEDGFKLNDAKEWLEDIIKKNNGI